MTTEQITTTIIKADEGKVLRRKSSGTIYGETVHLGYNYYDAGVGLSEAKLDTPDDFEEINKPEDYNEFKIDQVKRLTRIKDLVENNKNNINTFGLTNEESLQVIDWFPAWEANVGLKTGEKISYNGKLYEILQDHTSQDGWEPSINTASLFKEVAINNTFGTKDNPIEYNNNMALESGKYYIQNNIKYLCTRDTGTAVYNDLAALIDIYVIIAS